jgi:arylformamidase
MIMAYIDVSMPIHPQMMVYKNKPEKKPIFIQDNKLELGQSCETIITMNVHTGTHMDFPLHMMIGGKTSTDFDPNELIRRVKVLTILNTDKILAEHLMGYDLQAGDFILLKTDNSLSDTFSFSFTYLTKEAAEYAVNKKLAGIGIDALGIERDQPNHPTHSILMAANIFILEGLRLQAVEQGEYEMIALPLSMNGCDGLPMRVMLQEVK